MERINKDGTINLTWEVGKELSDMGWSGCMDHFDCGCTAKQMAYDEEVLDAYVTKWKKAAELEKTKRLAENEKRVEEIKARWRVEAKKREQEMWHQVKGKRFKLVRQCSCVSDGWGCCCSQPIVAKISDDGDFMLINLKQDNAMHYMDCGEIGGGMPHPASAHEKT